MLSPKSPTAIDEIDFVRRTRARTRTIGNANDSNHSSRKGSGIQGIQKPDDSIVAFRSIDEPESATTYLGADGHLYNHYYQKIMFGSFLSPFNSPPTSPVSSSPLNSFKESPPSSFSSVIEKMSEDGEEKDPVKLLCGLDRPAMKEIPLPSAYSNFPAYEAALLEWKFRVSGTLFGLKLPRPISRHFFRPRVTKERGATNDLTNLLSGGELLEEFGSISVPSSPKEPNPRELAEAEELYDRLAPFQLEVKVLARLVQGRKLNPLRTDAELAKLKLEKNPWDSRLLPTEPNPFDYSTFEEYELAMKNWTKVCEGSGSIPIPAHKMKEIIPISKPPQNAQVETIVEKSMEAQKEVVMKKFRNPRMTVVPFFEGMKEFVHPPDSNPVKVELNLSKEEISDPKAKEAVSKVFEDFSKKVSVSFSLNQITKDSKENLNEFSKKHGIGNQLSTIKPKPALLPMIHGIFKENSMVPSASLSKNAIVQCKQAKALRRTDLTGPVLMSCMDAPSIINGKAVTMHLPDFDIEHPNLLIDWDDRSVKDSIREKVIRLGSAGSKDSLNYSFHPKTSQNELKESAERFKDIFRRAEEAKSSILTEEQMSELVNLNMFLDQFESALILDLPQNPSLSYLDFVINSQTPISFTHFLQSMKNHRSPQSQSKISSICCKIIRSPNSKVLIDYILNDANSLGLLAKAMSFYSEEKIDIYPYLNESLQLFNTMFRTDYTSIINSIFCTYYLNIICQILSKTFNNVPLFLLENKKYCVNQVLVHLKEKTSFISTHIWKSFIKSSKSLACYGLFLFLQLANNRAKPLQDFLRSDEANLFAGFRCLFCSECITSFKFSHVQFIIKRVFGMLQSDLWRDWLLGKYTHTSLLEDLRSDQKEFGKWVPSHLAISTLELCCDTLKRPTTSRENLSFMMDGAFFSDILNHLVRISAHLDDRSSILCKLVEEIGSIYPKVATQKATKDTKFKKIGATEIFKILNLASDIQRDDSNTTKLYVQKSNLLYAIKQLTKNNDVFESIKKSSDFWQKINLFCKDSADINFNRIAWALFHQLVHRNQGVLNHLRKNNHLSGFLGLLAPNQKPIVIIHATQYLDKLFSMASIDAKRIEQGKPPRRETPKTLEKDFKILNEFYAEGFIKIHMTYRQLDTQGQAYVHMASLYHTFATSKNCEVLRKAAFKNVEYKNGIALLDSMFGSEADSQSSTTKRSGLTKSSVFDKFLGNK